MKTNSEEVGDHSYAWRRALPVYGSDNPRRATLYVYAFENGKALNDSARGCGDERVNRDAVRRFGQWAMVPKLAM